MALLAHSLLATAWLPSHPPFLPITISPRSQTPNLLVSSKIRMQAQDDQDDYFCELPVYLFEEDELSRAASNREKERFRLSLTIIPVVAPIVAFLSYDFVYLAFHEILDATRMWFSVDGGKSEIELITPLINGVVQPATGFVFGTLLASTIGSLRNRQVAIRASLNKEACDLRTLDSVLNNICELQTRTTHAAVVEPCLHVQLRIVACGNHAWALNAHNARSVCSSSRPFLGLCVDSLLGCFLPPF